MQSRLRELALFNLGADSELRIGISTPVRRVSRAGTGGQGRIGVGGGRETQPMVRRWLVEEAAMGLAWRARTPGRELSLTSVLGSSLPRNTMIRVRHRDAQSRETGRRS